VRKTVTEIHVRAISLRSRQGVLQIGGISVPCSLGRGGRKHLKREGDGATPVGVWEVRRLFHRRDRMVGVRTWRLPLPIRADSGWCETAGDRNYNRLVKLPYAASHETMRRDDGLYDIVVELSHNEKPRVQGYGSAIFLHLRRPDGGPTAGCIAVSLRDMRTILAHCGRRTRLVIWSASGPPAGANRK